MNTFEIRIVRKRIKSLDIYPCSTADFVEVRRGVTCVYLGHPETSVSPYLRPGEGLAAL